MRATATTDQPNLVLPVFIGPCEPSRLLAGITRCDLYGLSAARARLKGFLTQRRRGSDTWRIKRRVLCWPTDGRMLAKTKIQSIYNGKLTPITMQGLDETREKPGAQEQ